MPGRVEPCRPAARERGAPEGVWYDVAMPCGARNVRSASIDTMRIGIALVALGAFGSAVAAQAPRRLVVMCEQRALGVWEDLEALSRDFEKDNPGVEVQLLEQAGASTADDKIKFMLAGDLPLDVMRVDIGELAAFLDENALFDLDPYFSKDPTWRPDDYFRQPIDALRDARGHLFGLPSTFTPYVLYCNLDLLARAGLGRPKPDWTWDDFLRYARATTKDLDGDGKPDQFGISLTQWLQAVVPWIWQNGGELIDATNTKSRLGEPAVVDALQFLNTLLHVERVSSFDATFENQLSQGLFQAGRAAFFGPTGYWETWRFKHIKDFRWDVVPLPRGKRAATSIAMQAYVVPRTSREPELAYRYIRALGSDRWQRVLAKIGNGVPAIKSAAQSDAFLKPDTPPESEQVFLDVLSTARFMPPLANWRKIEALCQAEFQGSLLFRETDIARACARAAQKTDDYLARVRDRKQRPRLWRWTMEVSIAAAVLALLGGFVARRDRKPSAIVRRQERQGLAMLAPWAVGFVAFLFGPAVSSIVLSFCEWSPLRDVHDIGFVGSGNYAQILTDDTFWTSLRVTSLYAAGSVPLGLVIALALALLLDAETRTARALRTIIYLPAIVSPVIVAAVWRFILDPERGLLNRGLAQLGIEGPAWIRSETWVVPSFVLASLWAVGGQMLVFLAALKTVDRSLLDAARVDGAGPWRRLLHVTLPSLTPVILFNLLIGLINAFQIFAQPYVMTGGGPGNASRFLVLYIYETGFKHLEMGYASTIAWVMVAILAALSLVIMRTSRRWVHYAARIRE